MAPEITSPNNKSNDKKYIIILHIPPRSLVPDWVMEKIKDTGILAERNCDFYIFYFTDIIETFEAKKFLDVVEYFKNDLDRPIGGILKIPISCCRPL